jgi:hypothetical protein
MSFSKAQILTLCSSLALDLENDTALSTFFDDTVERLALLDKPPFTTWKLIDLVSGTASYSFESDMLALLHAVMDDSSIFPATEEELNGYSNSWQADTGTPIAYLVEYLNRKYTLYPEPDFNSGVTGAEVEPLGEDYPDDPLWILYAQDRAASIEAVHAFPVAFLTLAREFSHESLHTDEEFAFLCETIGQLLLTILGH